MLFISVSWFHTWQSCRILIHFTFSVDSCVINKWHQCSSPSLRHTGLDYPLNLFPFFKARSNVTFLDKSYLIAWPYTQLSTSPPRSLPKLNAKLNVLPKCFYSTFYMLLLYYSAHCTEATCLYISPQKNKLYHILLILIYLAPNMVPSSRNYRLRE